MWAVETTRTRKCGWLIFKMLSKLLFKSLPNSTLKAGNPHLWEASLSSWEDLTLTIRYFLHAEEERMSQTSPPLGKLFFSPVLWQNAFHCIYIHTASIRYEWRFDSWMAVLWTYQDKFASNVFLDRHWTIAIYIVAEFRGSQLKIHHTWCIKHTIRSPVDFVV